MQRKYIVFVALAMLCIGTASAQDWGQQFKQLLGQVTGDATTQPQHETAAPATQLPETRVAAGLRAALADGATWAVSQLGQKGGFWSQPARRIPLPGWVDKASFALQAAGYSQQLQQLHRTINRAAERAIGEVGPIVHDTISNMSVADAYAVFNGGEHAATHYLRQHAGDELASKIQPIVANATAQSRVAQHYQALVSQARPLLSLAPGKLDLDLNSYVTQQALDGLFALIAQQEAQIRAHPVATGSQLLQTVFGRG